MKYFSGFSLNKESCFFDEYIVNSDFCVAGFSYGAIKAFEYIYSSNQRVDTLQLFSPANFDNRDEKFKKLQLISYRKNKNLYIENFLKNTTYPNKNIDLSNFVTNSNIEELKELLYYRWDKNRLKELVEKGVKIEVYLGELDKIIDSKYCYDFYKEYSTLYFIKSVGHILQ